jgi:hypothetical protein
MGLLAYRLHPVLSVFSYYFASLRIVNMKRFLFSLVGFLLLSNLSSLHAQAPEKEKPVPTLAELAEELKKVKEEADTAIADAKLGGHNAWMLTSSALVMLMVGIVLWWYGSTKECSCNHDGKYGLPFRGGCFLDCMRVWFGLWAFRDSMGRCWFNWLAP